MVMISLRWARAAVLLSAVAIVVAHGDEHVEVAAEHAGAHSNMDMGMSMSTGNISASNPYRAQYDLPNYFSLESHSGMMLAHIVSMVLAWFFILPIGVMFSIGRSRFALPVQLVFLALNGVGVILGTAYNVSTPDLYENNAHHSIGWIATWIMTAHVIMSLLFVYAGRTTEETTAASERAAFLPATLHGLENGDHRPWKEYRWSGDSGHGTEPPSPERTSRDVSPADGAREYQHHTPESEFEDELEEVRSSPALKQSNFVERYLAKRIPRLVSTKLLQTMELVYNVIDRTSLILGFVALATGGVTYSGVFRSKNVFNGLAHFIKGGIFFWYGLLTLGRWMGAFSDLGWAWNMKPTRSEVGQWKASLPTAEFVESFVIFLYGSTNVFLEHLAAWGGKWTAQDFEHVSISIMFFGGGLCGMFIESKTIRKWLNTSIDLMPMRVEVHPSEAQEARSAPRVYNFSTNILPALIIMLLGIMMSSHHQDSMVSTMVHKQWGTLFVGFALARCLTYIIMWLQPPTSVYPSRPPTELISAFCLISGGLIFMASTKDIIHYMEVYNLMAMFIFTVTMGFTAFLMAYEIFVLSLKGWAKRRDTKMDARH